MAVPFGDQRVSSQNLDHLGLVAGMYDELGIGQVLDQAIEQDTKRRVATVGQLVKAMVLNGLGFVNRTLYLTPQFFHNKPVERLIGVGSGAEHLNDDALGRALEALYKADVTLLFALVTAQACQRLGLKGSVVHWDASSFHLDGVYNRHAPPPEGAKVIHITPGYSRDHRPDLNQVVLELIVESRTRLPLWMQPLSGNRSDTTSVGQTIEQHIDQLHAQHGVEYWVSDSVLFSEANLQRLAAHQAKWITRVPERLNLAHQVLNDPSRGESRALAPGYRCRTLEVEYAGVQQRWLVILSVAALQRAVPTVTRALRSDSQAEYQAFLTLCRQTFACAEDAHRAVEQFRHRLTTLRLDEVAVVPVYRHRRPGRPAPAAVPAVVGYQIQGAPYLPSDQRLWRAYRRACFILATNALDSANLSDLAVLQTYKSQQQAERGFRFLKDPMFQAATFYLKSPERIMALLMVMTVCLLVYAALEYRARTALARTGQRFPNQQGQPIPNPTMRWIFQYFEGIHILLIPDQVPLVLNLNDHHRLVIQLLGPPYERLYS